MTNEMNDRKGILFLVLFAIPIISSTNIDCSGKAFRCVNSTHFMICVDLGGGVSTTIDDFVIPCPPTTVCHEYNIFECEFPKTEVATLLVHAVGVSKQSDTNFTTSVINSIVVPTPPVEKSVVSVNGNVIETTSPTPEVVSPEPKSDGLKSVKHLAVVRNKNMQTITQTNFNSTSSVHGIDNDKQINNNTKLMTTSITDNNNYFKSVSKTPFDKVDKSESIDTTTSVGGLIDLFFNDSQSTVTRLPGSKPSIETFGGVSLKENIIITTSMKPDKMLPQWEVLHSLKQNTGTKNEKDTEKTTIIQTSSKTTYSPNEIINDEQNNYNTKQATSSIIDDNYLKLAAEHLLHEVVTASSTDKYESIETVTSVRGLIDLISNGAQGEHLKIVPPSTPLKETLNVSSMKENYTTGPNNTQVTTISQTSSYSANSLDEINKYNTKVATTPITDNDYLTHATETSLDKVVTAPSTNKFTLIDTAGFIEGLVDFTQREDMVKTVPVSKPPIEKSDISSSKENVIVITSSTSDDMQSSTKWNVQHSLKQQTVAKNEYYNTIKEATTSINDNNDLTSEVETSLDEVVTASSINTSTSIDTVTSIKGMIDLIFNDSQDPALIKSELPSTLPVETSTVSSLKGNDIVIIASTPESITSSPEWKVLQSLNQHTEANNESDTEDTTITETTSTVTNSPKDIINEEQNNYDKNEATTSTTDTNYLLSAAATSFDEAVSTFSKVKSTSMDTMISVKGIKDLISNDLQAQDSLNQYTRENNENYTEATTIIQMSSNASDSPNEIINDEQSNYNTKEATASINDNNDLTSEVETSLDRAVTASSTSKSISFDKETSVKRFIDLISNDHQSVALTKSLLPSTLPIETSTVSSIQGNYIVTIAPTPDNITSSPEWEVLHSLNQHTEANNESDTVKENNIIITSSTSENMPSSPKWKVLYSWNQYTKSNNENDTKSTTIIQTSSNSGKSTNEAINDEQNNYNTKATTSITDTNYLLSAAATSLDEAVLASSAVKYKSIDTMISVKERFDLIANGTQGEDSFIQHILANNENYTEATTIIQISSDVTNSPNEIVNEEQSNYNKIGATTLINNINYLISTAEPVLDEALTASSTVKSISIDTATSIEGLKDLISDGPQGEDGLNQHNAENNEYNTEATTIVQTPSHLTSYPNEIIKDEKSNYNTKNVTDSITDNNGLTSASEISSGKAVTAPSTDKLISIDTAHATKGLIDLISNDSLAVALNNSVLPSKLPKESSTESSFKKNDIVLTSPTPENMPSSPKWKVLYSWNQYKKPNNENGTEATTIIQRSSNSSNSSNETIYDEQTYYNTKQATTSNMGNNYLTSAAETSLDEVVTVFSTEKSKFIETMMSVKERFDLIANGTQGEDSLNRHIVANNENNTEATTLIQTSSAATISRKEIVNKEQNYYNEIGATTSIIDTNYLISATATSFDEVVTASSVVKTASINTATSFRGSIDLISNDPQSIIESKYSFSDVLTSLNTPPDDNATTINMRNTEQVTKNYDKNEIVMDEFTKPEEKLSEKSVVTGEINKTPSVYTHNQSMYEEYKNNKIKDSKQNGSVNQNSTERNYIADKTIAEPLPKSNNITYTMKASSTSDDLFRTESLFEEKPARTRPLELITTTNEAIESKDIFHQFNKKSTTKVNNNNTIDSLETTYNASSIDNMLIDKVTTPIKLSHQTFVQTSAIKNTANEFLTTRNYLQNESDTMYKIDVNDELSPTAVSHIVNTTVINIKSDTILNVSIPVPYIATSNFVEDLTSQIYNLTNQSTSMTQQMVARSTTENDISVDHEPLTVYYWNHVVNISTTPYPLDVSRNIISEGLLSLQNNSLSNSVNSINQNYNRIHAQNLVSTQSEEPETKLSQRPVLNNYANTITTNIPKTVYATTINSDYLRNISNYPDVANVSSVSKTDYMIENNTTFPLNITLYNHSEIATNPLLTIVPPQQPFAAQEYINNNTEEMDTITHIKTTSISNETVIDMVSNLKTTEFIVLNVTNVNLNTSKFKDSANIASTRSAVNLSKDNKTTVLESINAKNIENTIPPSSAVNIHKDGSIKTSTLFTTLDDFLLTGTSSTKSMSPLQLTKQKSSNPFTSHSSQDISPYNVSTTENYVDKQLDINSKTSVNIQLETLTNLEISTTRTGILKKQTENVPSPQIKHEEDKYNDVNRFTEIPLFTTGSVEKQTAYNGKLKFSPPTLEVAQMSSESAKTNYLFSRTTLAPTFKPYVVFPKKGTVEPPLYRISTVNYFNPQSVSDMTTENVINSVTESDFVVETIKLNRTNGTNYHLGDMILSEGIFKIQTVNNSNNIRSDKIEKNINHEYIVDHTTYQNITQTKSIFSTKTLNISQTKNVNTEPENDWMQTDFNTDSDKNVMFKINYSSVQNESTHTLDTWTTASDIDLQNKILSIRLPLAVQISRKDSTKDTVDTTVRIGASEVLNPRTVTPTYIAQAKKNITKENENANTDRSVYTNIKTTYVRHDKVQADSDNISQIDNINTTKANLTTSYSNSLQNYNTLNGNLEQHLTSTNHSVTLETRSHLNISDKENNETSNSSSSIKLRDTKRYDLSPPTENIQSNASTIDKVGMNVVFPFNCANFTRGKHSDKKDCRKFYICVGKLQPIVGTCPNNTVFSEINKQCTRNLSHCVRNNQFRCLFEGRFSDFFKDNIYYICLKNNMTGFVRYTLQCQNDYHLNKFSVKCEKNIEVSSQSASSVSENSRINNGESISIIKFKESQTIGTIDFQCEKEGKFFHAKDCRKYYICTKVKNVYRRKIKKCASDEVYDKRKKKCVETDSVEC